MDYEPQGFALDIFSKRYASHPEETWGDACERVAGHIASAETSADSVKYKQEFSKLLKCNLFMPGGRIWYGAGKARGQLQNCFVTNTADSREGWGKTVSDEIAICGTGGGLGINFSPIRPRGAAIQGTGGVATGAVSLMEILNAAGSVLKAGGGRRTALMFALDLDHPDIMEFLDKKLDRNELTNANVSVVFNQNPEEFFSKVREGGDLDLKFKGKVVGQIPASTVWEKIVSNALKNGEPGVLNGYFANRMSNCWYIAPLSCTNPCGELFLMGGESCCLGSLVLPRFVEDGKISWETLRKAIQLSVRFLDNVLTINHYPLPEIREICTTVRRIGLGIMGLHDTLLMLGLRYSSPEGLEKIDKIMAFIKNEAYAASIALAQEKGSFQRFEVEKYLKSGFIKTLKPSLRAAIRKHGIRNVALLTIAPTGTTSLVCNVTSGIEPMFAPAMLRKYQDGDILKSEVVIHPLFKSFVEAGKDVSHFEGTFDLSLRDHFEVQRACQKHLDNACSKTINIPQGAGAEFADLLMEYFPELKGATVYPDGSRENQPLTPIPADEAFVLARGDISLEAYAQSTCRSGKCDL